MPLRLITGATGWCGTRLVQVLQQNNGHEQRKQPPAAEPNLRCLVFPGSNTDTICASGQVEIVTGDLRNPADAARLCLGAEGATLFHCAGLIHPRLLTRELYETNVRGTENILKAALAAGVRRVVILSSNSPFGVNPHREHRFDENSPYRPYMNYGRSKMLMEKLAQDISAAGRMEMVILRPTWFYGPEQPLRQTTFFSMIKSGMAPILGDGGNMRSMVYIDNLCQAMLLAERTPQAAGQTFWVADRRAYSMNEIVDTVEKLMEEEFSIPVTHKRLRLPFVAGELAQYADWTIQSLGFYQQKIHVMSEMNKTIACSIDKARQVLGYEPQIDLEEGMRRSLRWCIERGVKI
jgi:nucleoside-diphosphate-sugar epimerase